MCILPLQNFMHEIDKTYFLILSFRKAILIAVIAASSPLFPWIPPDRALACSIVLVVSTPKIKGILYSRLSRIIPWDTLSQMNVKCGVSPCMTHPIHIMASRSWLSAIIWAPRGSSKLPGTCRTIMLSFLAPCLIRVFLLL